MTYDPAVRVDLIGDMFRMIPGRAWRSNIGALPWWAMQAVRKVSVLAGEERIAYVTGVPYETPGFDGAGNHLASRPGRLIVYTDTLLAVATITEVPGQVDPTVATTVEVVNRRSLRKITTDGTRVTVAPNNQQWPDELDLFLHYDSIEEPVRLLPDELSGIHQKQLEDIREFVSTLLTDLAPHGEPVVVANP